MERVVAKGRIRSDTRARTGARGPARETQMLATFEEETVLLQLFVVVQAFVMPYEQES